MFIRGKYDIKLSLDSIYFETDHRFSTIAEYKVAKIIANDLIQGHLVPRENDVTFTVETKGNHQTIKTENYPLTQFILHSPKSTVIIWELYG